MKNRSTKLTRREFLSISALAAAGTTLRACLPSADTASSVATATPSGRSFIPIVMNNYSEMPMATLPQNLLTRPGTLYEDFETVEDWTASAGSVAANTTQFKIGTQSIKITSAVGSHGRIEKNLGTPWNLTGFGRMSLWLYIHNTNLTDYGDDVYIHFYTTSSDRYYANFFTSNFRAGWQIVNLNQSDFAASGSPDWSNITRMAIRITGAPGEIAEVSVDGLFFGRIGLPAIMLDFDDGYTSHYTIAFAKMRDHGIRGSLNCITNLVGTANFVTQAQLHEMDAAGWTIANHTNATTDLSTLSEAAQESQIIGGQTALNSWGLPRGKNYLAYPSCGWNANTLTAIARTGTLIARGCKPHTSRICVLPPYHLDDIESTGVGNLALETAERYVDDAIAQGNILPLHAHDLGSGGGQWTQATFDAFIDYVVSKKSQIHVITKDDFYKLTLGPVRVPRIQ